MGPRLTGGKVAVGAGSWETEAPGVMGMKAWAGKTFSDHSPTWTSPVTEDQPASLSKRLMVMLVESDSACGASSWYLSGSLQCPLTSSHPPP